eukprot:13038000-Ditylum_brightwellii.AAC.1
MAWVPSCRVVKSSLCCAAGETWKALIRSSICCVLSLSRSAAKSCWSIVMQLLMKDVTRALGDCFLLKAL